MNLFLPTPGDFATINDISLVYNYAVYLLNQIADYEMSLGQGDVRNEQSKTLQPVKDILRNEILIPTDPGLDNWQSAKISKFDIYNYASYELEVLKNLVSNIIAIANNHFEVDRFNKAMYEVGNVVQKNRDYQKSTTAIVAEVKKEIPVRTSSTGSSSIANPAYFQQPAATKKDNKLLYALAAAGIIIYFL